MGRFVSTIALVVILAGLGGYIYFVDSKKPAGGTETKQKAFENVQADQIEELQIKVTDGDTSRLQKADNTWKLLDPVQADADTPELSNMASSLAALEIQRVVEENPAQLKDYGLDPPKVEVSFRTKGQKDFRRLQIGDKTPTGNDVYAKKPDDKRVFLVSAFLDDTFKRNAFDLRDKAILKFARDKVTGLAITNAKSGTMELVRKGTDWTFVKPSAMRADYSGLEGTITSLSATLMQKFVTEQATPQELAQYGLAKPSASATILMGDTRRTLLLGKTDNAETYAKLANTAAVVMVAPTIVEDLNKGVSDFRRKELFDMRYYNADRVEVKRGADTFVFEKSKDKDGKDVWKNAAGANVDASKMEDFLTKLANLRAQSFRPGSVQSIKTPELVASAKFDNGKMETVTLGRIGGDVVGGRPDEPDVATLEMSAFDQAIKALDAVK